MSDLHLDQSDIIGDSINSISRITTKNPWSPGYHKLTCQGVMVTSGDGNVGQIWNNDVFTKHGKKMLRQETIYQMVHIV